MLRTLTCTGTVVLSVLIAQQFAISGAQTILTPHVLQQCIDECEEEGYCCGNRLNGEAPHTAAKRLSCANGCEIAFHSTNVEQCEDYCKAGNKNGCTYKHPLIDAEFSKCQSCQEGCNDSPSTQACKIGCDKASTLNFYNQLDTSLFLEAEEVEESKFDGGVIANNTKGYTGSGYFKFTKNSGHIIFDLDIDSDNSYLFKVRYSNANYPWESSELHVDGDYYDSLWFDKDNEDGKRAWGYTESIDIPLSVGKHVIEIKSLYKSKKLYIDHAQLTNGPTPSPTPSPCDSKAPRGYLFVPHTNKKLPANHIAPLLKIMYCDQNSADILLSNEPNVPTFYSGCGIASTQSRMTCQRSNAGLFYWPSGERNAYYNPPYNHNRTKMLAHVHDGIEGYDAQSLVIHPESDYSYYLYGSSTPSVDVPEYVYEGVRLWSEAAGGDAGSGRVLLVLSKMQDAGAVFGIASKFRSMGVSIVPVAFAIDLLPESLKSPAVYQISPLANAIRAAIEAGCLYSHEMDQQFEDDGFLHNHFALDELSPIDISDIMAAAHQAVQDGKQFSDVLSWASSAGITIPQSGGSHWFGSVKTRNLRYETWGTSTESGLKGAYGILGYGGMKGSFLGNSNKGDKQPSWKGTAENPSDIMLKRSMASAPGPSDYYPDEEEVKRYRVWMKFDYPIDKKSAAYGDWNVQTLDASYYGATYNAVRNVLPMIKNGQKANYFSARWFMAHEVTESPYPPGAKVMRDNVHISNEYNQGIASGMLTLVTGGRSFIGDKPNDDVTSTSWQNWHARRTGYILAWRFATLCLRPPFLEIKPNSSTNSDALPYGTEPGTGAESATVRLLEAPESDVTISIEVDDDADGVVITPSNIVLTPSDYIFPIPVYVVSSGKVAKGTEINVFFRTSSDDEAVNGIEDMWMFTTGDQPPTSSPTTSSPTTSSSPTSSPSTSTSPTTSSPTTSSSPTSIPSSNPTKSAPMCSALGKKWQIRNFCNNAGRVENPSKFPIFWEYDMNIDVEKECESDPCTPSDCCKEGRKRKCSNTNNTGGKKPFKKENCDEGWILHSKNKRKKKKCTGSNGKICLSEDCCKKEK